MIQLKKDQKAANHAALLHLKEMTGATQREMATAFGCEEAYMSKMVNWSAENKNSRPVPFVGIMKMSENLGYHARLNIDPLKWEFEKL